MTMRSRRSEAEGPALPGSDPAHAPGKHRKSPPPLQGRAAQRTPAGARAHQPWVPTSGLIGKQRRSARRS
jgi:hypothetical protein